VDDQSFSLSPEFLYTGFTNQELMSRTNAGLDSVALALASGAAAALSLTTGL
jgi:hypothetical protein